MWTKDLYVRIQIEKLLSENFDINMHDFDFKSSVFDMLKI